MRHNLHQWFFFLLFFLVVLVLVVLDVVILVVVAVTGCLLNGCFCVVPTSGSRTSVTATTWGVGTDGQVRELWWGAAEAQAFLDLEGRRWLTWPIYGTGILENMCNYHQLSNIVEWYIYGIFLKEWYISNHCHTWLFRSTRLACWSFGEASQIQSSKHIRLQ